MNSPEQLILKFLKQELSVNPVEFAKKVQDFEVSPEDRLELARLFVRQQPMHAVLYIEKLAIENEADRIALAKELARTSYLPERIQNFKIKSQQVLVELARIAAESGHGSELAKNFKRYGIQDQKAIVKIARLALETDPRAVQNFDAFGIEEERERIALAKLSISKDALLVANHFFQFHIHGAEARLLLARKMASALGSLFLSTEAFSHLELVSSFKEKTVSSGAAASVAELMAQHPMAGFAALFSGTGMDADWTHYESLAALQSALKAALVPGEMVGAAWDRVKKIETGLRLMGWGFRFRREGRLSEAPTSSEILSTALGLPPDVLSRNGYSINALGEFYELALDIQGKLEDPFFKGVKLDPELFLRSKNGAKMTAFLSLARDLIDLSGFSDPDAEWARLRARFKIDGLDAQCIDSINSMLQEHLIESVKGFFSGKSGIRFSSRSFEKLERQWGDLRPIYTLLARYAGRLDWGKELLALAQIFKASLAGQFKRLKFHGDAKDKEGRDLRARQLAGLDAAKIRKLKKERAKVELFKPEMEAGASIGGPIKSNILRMVQGNLLPRLRAHLMKASGEPKEKEPFSFLSTMVSQLEQAPETAFAATEAVLEALHYRLRDLGLGAEIGAEIGEIHAQIEMLQRKNVQASGKESVVLTVLSHDPRFLLTIGDLVRASSCQNYKTGAEIQALPAYALDANVFAIASFSLTPASFTNVKDWEKLKETLRSSSVAVDFDGNRNIAKIKFADGATVSTLPLAHAHNRHIGRFGRIAGTQTPAIYLERAYFQPHEAHSIMDSQTKAIFGELARDLGAATKGAMEFEASVNFGGVYVDALHGIQTGSYAVQVD